MVESEFEPRHLAPEPILLTRCSNLPKDLRGVSFQWDWHEWAYVGVMEGWGGEVV